MTLHTPDFTLCTPHSTLYILHSHFTLGAPHSALDTVRSTLYTLHLTLYTRDYILLPPHCTLYTRHFTLHNLRFTMYTLHFQLNTPLSAHSTPRTPVHSTLHSLHWYGNRGRMHRAVEIICFTKSVLRDCIPMCFDIGITCEHSGLSAASFFWASLCLSVCVCGTWMWKKIIFLADVWETGEHTPLTALDFVLLCVYLIFFGCVSFGHAIFSLTTHRFKFFVCKMHRDSLKPAALQNMGLDLAPCQGDQTCLW